MYIYTHIYILNCLKLTKGCKNLTGNANVSFTQEILFLIHYPNRIFCRKNLIQYGILFTFHCYLFLVSF